jgi:undecaprenyl-diphosphatase
MDYRIFHQLNGIATHGALVGLIRGFAEYSIVAFPAALVLLWLLPGDNHHAVRTAAVMAAVSALVALGMNQVINHIVNRPRPYAGHHVRLLLPRSGDASFPSDHTAVAFAVAAALWPERSKLAATLGLIGTALAVSRVIAGVHYPGDVAAGAAVGISSALLMWLVAAVPVGILTAHAERLYAWLLSPLRRLTSAPP